MSGEFHYRKTFKFHQPSYQYLVLDTHDAVSLLLRQLATMIEVDYDIEEIISTIIDLAGDKHSAELRLKTFVDEYSLTDSPFTDESDHLYRHLNTFTFTLLETLKQCELFDKNGLMEYQFDKLINNNVVLVRDSAPLRR